MPAPNINQMTADLAAMSDQQLQSYAALHKNDPYTISLAMSESNRRKAMRTPQGAMGMPKVVDVEIANMAREALRDKNALPENTGIAALPENSMSGMADGGIIGYADEGAVRDPAAYEQDVKERYRDYAMTQAEKMGLDPSFADSIFKIESGYKANADSGVAYGIGQLKPATAEGYGLKKEDRRDPYKNIDASLAFMKDLQNRYGGDKEKMAVGYNQGETVLNKHLNTTGGVLDVATLNKPEATNYLKRLNQLLPMSSAQAADVPGRPVQAAPAVQMPEGTDAQAAELERRGLILDAAREKMKGLPTMGGLRQQRLDAVTQTKMGQERQAAQKELDAAEDSYRKFAEASPINKAVQNQPYQKSNLKTVQPAPVPLVQAMAAPSAVNAPSSGASAPKAVPMPYADEGLSPASIGAGRVAPKVEPAVAAKAIAAAKQALPPEKLAGLGWEDLMMFGLQLMAGKSQYAMQNIGEAGIGALGAKAAREKAASEAAYYKAKGAQTERTGVPSLLQIAEGLRGENKDMTFRESIDEAYKIANLGVETKVDATALKAANEAIDKEGRMQEIMIQAEKDPAKKAAMEAAWKKKQADIMTRYGVTPQPTAKLLSISPA